VSRKIALYAGAALVLRALTSCSGSTDGMKCARSGSSRRSSRGFVPDALALDTLAVRANYGEAFRALEESGLVRLEKNRGVFVRQIDVGEADQIYELRCVLDEFVGRRVAQLDLGVLAPLGQPGIPLVGSTQRGLAQPIGEVFTHVFGTFMPDMPLFRPPASLR
jgi:hypothetical protein